MSNLIAAASVCPVVKVCKISICVRWDCHSLTTTMLVVLALSPVDITAGHQEKPTILIADNYRYLLQICVLLSLT